MGIIPCEIPLLEFDPEQTAVIGPDYEQLDLHLPRKCVFAFLGGYIDRYAHAAGARQVAAFNSATKLYPIYVTTYHGQEVALCQAPVGAAAAAQLLDWLISCGTRGPPTTTPRPPAIWRSANPPGGPSSKPSSPTICAIRRSSHGPPTASSVRRRRRSPTAKARAAPWWRWSALPLRPAPPSLYSGQPCRRPALRPAALGRQRL